jgi:uncharacterized repeat protein (TIGR01451 family)/fimbrial isopeptide formation D2 family protein
MIRKNKWLKVDIMNKIAFIINIIKSIFIATILWLSFAQAASANLVTNPFFTGTTAAATSWTSSQGSPTPGNAAFNRALSAANATITAAGGSTEFYSGCVPASCLTFPFVSGTSSGAQQTITTVVGTTYTLSFWVYSSGSGTVTNPTEIDVYWGNTKVYAGVNVTPAGWSLQTVNLGVAATASNTLTVLIRDVPSFSAITYIDVEPVVLRLAKTNPASLAVGVPANYTLTTTNISTTTSGTSFQIQDQLPPNIQYNSAAAGTGVTGVACAASGTVAAGQLVTCTVSATGGIPPGGAGTITLNVTPQAASGGVAGTNRASVQYNGGVVGVAASASMATNAAPSTCTGTDTGTGPAPVVGLGCAVAPSITPAASQLTFTKTVTTICDPINGGNPTSNPSANPKNIPGAIVRYTLTVANSGATTVNLATVSDLISSNTTFEPNLVTGAGTVTPAITCNSASGTPESGAGKGFKLSIVGGTRTPGNYPKFFTTAAADDAATGGPTVTINFAQGLPAEAGYAAGELRAGESVIVYFDVVIN